MKWTLMGFFSGLIKTVISSNHDLGALAELREKVKEYEDRQHELSSAEQKEYEEALAFLDVNGK